MDLDWRAPTAVADNTHTMQAKALIGFFMAIMLLLGRANVKSKSSNTFTHQREKLAAFGASSTGLALLFDKPLQRLCVLVV